MFFVQLIWSLSLSSSQPVPTLVVADVFMLSVWFVMSHNSVCLFCGADGNDNSHLVSVYSSWCFHDILYILFVSGPVVRILRRFKNHISHYGRHRDRCPFWEWRWARAGDRRHLLTTTRRYCDEWRDWGRRWGRLRGSCKERHSCPDR